MPDFTKLRTLHDWIMDNVPPERFSLNYIWINELGGSGCALGWAPKIFGETVQASDWVAEAQQLFGLTEHEAIDLFRSRVPMLESKYHKQAWHARVQRFFAEHGEPLKRPTPLVPESPPVSYFNKLRSSGQRDREREPELVD